VLDSHDEGRLIAIALAAGERLQDHEVHERTWLMVTSGQIEVAADGDTVIGPPGFMATFDPHERREIVAVTDAFVMMVLAPWPGAGR
jgi:quercetin dioxygenase-like cupin family protein